MKITICGDVADWNMENFNVKNIPEKYTNKIKKSDLFIANFEGPISIENSGFRTKTNKIKNKFWNLILDIFNKRQPRVYSSEKILNVFKLNKNTITTLANNHLKDCGKKGLDYTISKLNENNISFMGAGDNLREANKEKILNSDNRKIIILNYNRIGLRKFKVFANIYGATKRDFGTAYFSYSKIKHKIKFLKKQYPNCFILLILHDGGEMPTHINKSRLEINKIEKLGANLNVVHHPHTHIPFDSKKTFILGDFIFNRPGKLPENRIGNLLEINLKEDNSFDSQLNKFNFTNGYPRK